MTEARKKTEPLKPIIVMVGSDSVNLLEALPLNIGDIEDLEKNGVVLDGGSLKTSDLVHVVLHIAQKLNKDAKRDDVRKLSVPDMKRLNDAIKVMSEPDPPSPGSST